MLGRPTFIVWPGLYGKVVRLFNLSTGEKNSGLTPGAVVTHQTWMLLSDIWNISYIELQIWKNSKFEKSGLFQASITAMIIAYLNVVLSLCNERECMKKDSVIESSPNTVYLSCLLSLLCRSNWPISIDLKGFACHWRFVTWSQQLCSKSFLLPDIEIASFPLSRRLLQCFKRQASKRNNLAKERVANVSLGVVGVHVT